MCKHISKAIVRQSATIRNALEKYNHLALLQTPSCPTLTYAEITTYASLSEFTLLKYSCHDIATKPWTIPLNREIALKYHKILHAQEEFKRLIVEACRLHAWVDYEDNHLLLTVAKLQHPEPVLVAEIQLLYMTRHAINNLHRKRLRLLYALDGYSGPGAPDTTQEAVESAE